MNKKDKALKKCLRVLNPIADERMYETQWIDSAIYAAYEALEEKEWQGLTDDEIENEFLEFEEWQVPLTEDGHDKQERRHYVFVKACKIAEQKLKEKNYGV